ncbi:MAG: hypothetical protein ACFB15_28560 [Cyclobacteriaceae bacterium]
MKKIILNLALILGLALTIFSCEDDDTVTKPSLQDDIVGQWTHSSVSLSVDGVNYTDYLRQNYPDLMGDQTDVEIESSVNEVFDELLGDVLELQDNSIFVSTYSDSEPEPGNWSVNEQTRTLMLNYEDPDDEFESPNLQLTIESFTDNVLEVSEDFEGSDALFGLLKEEETLKVTVSFDRL